MFADFSTFSTEQKLNHVYIQIAEMGALVKKSLKFYAEVCFAMNLTNLTS